MRAGALANTVTAGGAVPVCASVETGADVPSGGPPAADARRRPPGGAVERRRRQRRAVGRARLAATRGKMAVDPLARERRHAEERQLGERRVRGGAGPLANTAVVVARVGRHGVPLVGEQDHAPPRLQARPTRRASWSVMPSTASSTISARSARSIWPSARTAP